MAAWISSRSSPLPLELTALAKIFAHWLSTGLPLTLLSPLLALMFNLPPTPTLVLFFSLLIGTPAVSAIGAIGASLTLSLKRGGLILPLLILPLLAPAVIFGAGAVSQPWMVWAARAVWNSWRLFPPPPCC